MKAFPVRASGSARKKNDIILFDLYFYTYGNFFMNSAGINVEIQGSVNP